jgi:hypothetical protein
VSRADEVLAEQVRELLVDAPNVTFHISPSDFGDPDISAALVEPAGSRIVEKPVTTAPVSALQIETGSCSG